MRILGIESSCDETAAAVVCDGREVQSNVVFSQMEEHRPYGGVVPELASRAHVEAIGPVIQKAMETAGADWSEIDHLAVTHGPGLASSLLIGVTTARALALRLNKPLIGVNHLAGHAYSVFMDPTLTDKPEAVGPLVVLLVTGGNTLLLRVDEMVRIRVLGQTLDDAAGEALDKGATLMGLGYPGGPEIEREAEGGDPTAIAFPRGLRGSGTLPGGLRRECCFSYSGLKTALMNYIRHHPESLTPDQRPHLAASYQEAVFDTLVERLERAVREEGVTTMGCVGGVAKNKRLRNKLDALAGRMNTRLLLAPAAYCTDNAAMIAGVAHALLQTGDPQPPVQGVFPNLPLGTDK